MIVAFGLAACGGDEEYASIKELADTRDLFLYSKVDRVKKPEKDSSESSTHTSSSGTTHGGGGGKF